MAGIVIVAAPVVVAVHENVIATVVVGVGVAVVVAVNVNLNVNAPGA